MKILIVHNFYGSENPSGENNLVINEKEYLKNNGFEVETMFTSSDYLRKKGVLGGIIGGLSFIWNISAFYRIDRIIRKAKPDFIHIHNVFPLLSPSIFFAIRKNKVPFGITLHNYRLFCSAGVPLLNGKECTSCLKGTQISKVVKNKCYRNSSLASFVMSIALASQRILQIWTKIVPNFFVFSDFQKTLFEQMGIPAHKITVKPNMFFEHIPEKINLEKRSGCIYVGRLSEEKGILDLLEAWSILGEDAPHLHFVGDGELSGRVRQECSNSNKIHYHGYVNSDVKNALIDKSRLLLVPSRWFEGQPNTILEGFARGAVVCVSEVGALPSFVKNGKIGYTFPANSPTALAKVVDLAYNDNNLKSKANLAYEELKRCYSPLNSVGETLKLYMRLIREHRRDIVK